MLNPWQVLGVSPAASAEEVHHAYHELVKRWHPDRFQDPVQKAEAQQRLLAINNAYSEAQRHLGSHPAAVPYDCEVNIDDAKRIARRMADRGSYAGALRELLRSGTRDASWYALQGEILSAMKQYESAAQSWREAVRRDPENLTYRRGALDADTAFKKSQTLSGRIKGFFEKKR